MLRLPYLRITPAIAAVSSYTTCSVLSILSAVAITSYASFHPQEEPPHIAHSPHRKSCMLLEYVGDSSFHLILYSYSNPNFLKNI